MPDIKVCSKCGTEKPLTEFHRNRSRPSGYASWCKACKKLWRKKNPEKRRASQARYRQTRKSRLRDRKYRSKAAAKIAARSRVTAAVERGELKPAAEMQCYECGGDATGYHHYAGYGPGLELAVVPLCNGCHYSKHETEVPE